MPRVAVVVLLLGAGDRIDALDELAKAIKRLME
jgi:hypothetical protein